MERNIVYSNRHYVRSLQDKRKKKMDNQSETANFFIKFGIYIGSVTLGLAAKLFTINNQRKLHWKEVLMHSCVAFAAAWLVWNVMNYYKAEEWAKNGVAVIVGRFGDAVLIAAWKYFRMLINSENKDII
jgi:hypothetical protein